MDSDKGKRVTEFLQRIVEALTPSVIEAVEKDASGKFQIEFHKGEYQRGRKDVPL